MELAFVCDIFIYVLGASAADSLGPFLFACSSAGVGNEGTISRLRQHDMGHDACRVLRGPLHPIFAVLPVCAVLRPSSAHDSSIHRSRSHHLLRGRTRIQQVPLPPYCRPYWQGTSVYRCSVRNSRDPMVA